LSCLTKRLPLRTGRSLVVTNPDHPHLAEPTPPPASSTFSLMASSMLRRLALRGGAFGRALRRLALRMGKGTLRASKIEPVLTGTEHFNRDHLPLGMTRLALR